MFLVVVKTYLHKIETMIEYSDINPLQTYLCIILFSFSEDKIQGRFVVLKKALFLLNT